MKLSELTPAMIRLLSDDDKVAFGISPVGLPQVSRARQESIPGQSVGEAQAGNETVGNVRRMPAAGEKLSHENSNPPQVPIPKRSAGYGTLAAPKAKARNPKRIPVRITNFSRRLYDPDNVMGKWHLDCCRYAGILKDDREQDIILTVTQEKVATKEEERTEIEIDC
jgi:hypothetical protein